MTLSSAPSVQYGFAFGDGTGSNQWLFGGAGQGVQVLQVEGLEGLPNLRTQDTGRGYADGSFSGRDFLDSRSIVFTLQIMSDANYSMQTYLQELQQYLMPQRSGLNVLQVYLPGGRGVRRIYGRVRKRQISVDPQYVYGRATAQLEFFCPDPRFYSDTATVTTINSVTAYSRSYNKTYPFTYPNLVTGASGVAPLKNNGNYESWPSFSLTASTTASNITINNFTTGQYLSLPSLTLNTSDTLIIDSDLATVLLNNQPSRNLLSTGSRWFPMPPGGVLQRIGVSSASGTVNCTITFRDAYI